MGMTTKKRSKRQSRRRPGRPGSPTRPTRPRSGPPSPSTRLVRPDPEDIRPRTPEPHSEGQRFVDEIRAISRSLSEALTNEHPLIFLLKVSQTCSMLDGRTVEDSERIDLSDMLASIATSDLAGFRALGYGLSRMVGRDHERAAFDAAYSRSATEFPEWLRELDRSEIAGCWRGYHDDLGDVVGVGVRFADDQEGTLVIVTCGDSDEIMTSYLSLCPYAEVALNWATNDPAATGLTKITYAAAHAALTRAIRSSDPTDPDEQYGRAEWVLGRAIMEWIASMLDLTLVAT